MKKVDVHILNAFADNGRGGNPAGVVFDADHLSEEEMQAIAAQVGFPETAFVGRSDMADFRTDFFTPTKRIADCGHATVAAFSHMAAHGQLKAERSSKEIILGRREILIDGEQAFLEIGLPQFHTLSGDQLTRLLEAVQATPEDLIGEPMLVSTGPGLAGIMLPLRGEDQVSRIRPDLDAIYKLTEEMEAIMVYAFSPETRGEGRIAGARMFAPFFGIDEEAATGMAAGMLAPYLYEILGLKKDVMVIEQGHLMPEPSPARLEVRLNVKDGRVIGCFVGGRALPVRQITVSV